MEKDKVAVFLVLLNNVKPSVTQIQRIVSYIYVYIYIEICVCIYVCTCVCIYQRIALNDVYDAVKPQTVGLVNSRE